MKPAIIIGLCGLAGTGKDTVRAMLQDLGYTGFALADPIRSTLRDLLLSNGISDEYIDNRELKESTIPELGVSYRHMAQTLGTDWARNCLGEDFWVRLAGAFLYDQIEQGGTHFCVSDIRFENEAQWVRSMGGVIWRIERNQAAPVRAHISEAAATAIASDTVIDNNGSVGDLHRAVTAALDGLL